jgi:HAE1 family hydrophobic/amphiphilic exporter-1
MSRIDHNNLPAYCRNHRRRSSMWRSAFAATAVFGTVSAALLAPSVCAQTVTAEDNRIGRGAPLTLTARDAIELALKSNLDIRLERYALDINHIRFRGAAGAYDPQATLSGTAGAVNSVATSLLQAGTDTRLTDSNRSFSTGIRQSLKTGGSWSVDLSESRTATNNPFLFVNPSFGAGLNLRLEQPLLRGLTIDAARRQLRVLNLNMKIGDAQFRQAVAELVLRVIEQYWNLEYAREASAAREESRDLATAQRNQIQQQVQAGLLTPIALASANAEVALREQEIIRSQVQIVVAENGLKELLAEGPGSEVWRRTLVPIEKPVPHESPQSLDVAIQEALRNRPELESLGLQVRQNEVDRIFYKGETRPQANVVATLGSSGRAGTVYTPVYDNTGGIVPVALQLDAANPSFGGIGKSLSQMLGFGYSNWTVGVNVQVPIGNRSAKAQMAEAEVGRARLETQIKRQQQSVMVEVANAFESMMLQRKAMDVARMARELSQEQVRGEMARFEAGFATNFEVLRYQRDLADARVQELRAMVDYEIALATLQKATAQIINENDLVIARTQR